MKTLQDIKAELDAIASELQVVIDTPVEPVAPVAVVDPVVEVDVKTASGEETVLTEAAA